MSNIQTLAADARKKKAQKAQKARKAMKYIRGYGDAPVWTGVTVNDVDYDTKLGRALNWATQALERYELKAEVLKYANNDQLKKLPDWKFVATGKLAWILNNGGPLKEKDINSLKSEIAGLVEQAEQIKEEVKPVVSQGLLEKAYLLYSLIDDEVFADKMPNVDYLLFKHKPARASVNYVIQKFIAQRNEFVEFFNKTKEEQIEYGFASVNLKNKIALVDKVLLALGHKEKAPHVEKKKVADTSKLRLGTNTVPAEKLLGAKQAVLYDEEAGWLLVYTSSKGLSIDGLKIVNYDTAVGKKFTKDAEQVQKVRGMNEAQFKVLYEGLKNKECAVSNYTKTKHVILRVF